MTVQPRVPSKHVRIDRRIERTRRTLHEALGELIQEKAYDRITVTEILDRASVSRSAFYMHFRDKDDLLESCLRDLLHVELSTERAVVTELYGQTVAFSLPFFEHLERHRRAVGARMDRAGHATLHERLRRFLSTSIGCSIERSRRSQTVKLGAIAPALLAEFVSTTFALVVQWWLDGHPEMAAAEVDRIFRTLVTPALSA
ncbi:MAG TPA: TetR/AcrR family transcriptional regulator [Rhodanobacteraceae bacterium]|nr:TetR/AcrR family transcriptional regulator [Rhodanobacteraceae bacterium]